MRRVITAGIEEPYDIEVFPAVRARVYPKTNVCEKRVFAAAHLYDWEERHALSKALAETDADPFVFVDLGANAGVYTLWIVSEARRLGKSLRVLAVEPDPETFARLTSNLAMSRAEHVTPVQCAVGASEGRGQIICHSDNRGEHRIALSPVNDSASVTVLPLHALCAQHEIGQIDAVKVDLEGLDQEVLGAYFAQAPDTQWPDWIIVEVGKLPHAPVVGLCERHGYRLQERTKLNAILQKAVASGKTS